MGWTCRAGGNIVMPDNSPAAVTEDGTSFASPYVAGSAALVSRRTRRPRRATGSILTSGVDNRDGSGETGNTTTLEFSRLGIDAALKLTSQRVGGRRDRPARLRHVAG